MISTIFWLFVLHFVSDFLLQPRKMATKKSSHWGWWSAHVAITWMVFLEGGWLLGLPLWFSFANAGAHGLIDAVIWRAYKWAAIKRGKGDDFHYWEDHWFYTTIGFDQLLHGATLILLVGVAR